MSNDYTALYGIPLVNLQDPHTEKLYTTWRKCVRLVLCIPRRTHSRYLHLICNDEPVQHQIRVRFLKFFQSLMKSRNELVFRCAVLAQHGSGSAVANSLTEIIETFRTHRVNIPNVALNLLPRPAEREEDVRVSSFIQDVLHCRYECTINPSSQLLNFDEIGDILTCLCTE